MSVIFLDSGHPSRKGDRGAVWPNVKGRDPSLLEMTLNWEISLRTRGLLTKLPHAEPILSKHNLEEVLSLERRCGMAHTFNSDLAISFHHNASKNPNYHGMRVFYNNSVAHEVAEVILANAPLGLERRGRVPTHMNEKGWERVARVLKQYRDIPAVLVEVGYMTNDNDRRLMQQSQVKDAVAAAIVAGVARFIQL